MTNIAILGAGPSGLMTALSLASIGVKVTLLEARSIKNGDFPLDVRTTALTYDSLGILGHKVRQDILDISGKIKDIYVVNNKAPGILHFPAQMVARGALGYIVHNTELKKLLLEKVVNHPNIKLIDNCLYTKIESFDNEVVISLPRRFRSKHASGRELLGATDTEDRSALMVHEDLSTGATTQVSAEVGFQITADLLIMCNGHLAKSTKQFFTAKFEKYYLQTALTFIVSHTKPHEGTAVEHFLPNGPFAILPLKEENKSSVVWTLPSDFAELMLNLPTCEFEYHVQENFGDFLGNIKIDGEVMGFPLKAYVTDSYYFQKIVLVGDSAHVVHPLAGQGLNQGIKDIEALTNLLSKFGPTDRCLMEYERSRKDDNLMMYQITDLLNSFFSNNSGTLNVIRRCGLKIIDRFTPLKRYLMHYAMGQR